ncbi:hypothetical protein SVIO_025870 [Streptomyces violaceusniger]|uniref:Uncharacterized protein n=2 Tax=Streptomyces violaceusniger TaxID=68280 RepID=A0A4D4KUW9_STRVO|nr:hypothetical protein SVIO_025870 [Streptomyces violaceusniger]
MNGWNSSRLAERQRRVALQGVADGHEQVEVVVGGAQGPHDADHLRAGHERETVADVGSADLRYLADRVSCGIPFTLQGAAEFVEETEITSSTGRPAKAIVVVGDWSGAQNNASPCCRNGGIR